MSSEVGTGVASTVVLKTVAVETGPTKRFQKSSTLKAIVVVTEGARVADVLLETMIVGVGIDEFAEVKFCARHDEASSIGIRRLIFSS